MKRLPFMTIAVLAGAVLGSPVTAASEQASSVFQAVLGESGSKTSEVSTETMRRIVADGSAVIIDSRSQAEFDAGHIPGAIVPVGSGGPAQIASISQIVGGDKAKALVVYCNGPYCQASRRLADLLTDAGFTNVRRYQLGIPVWRALGGPTAIEIDGVRRVAAGDRLAVFIDTRPSADFVKGSLPTARSAPLDDLLSGKLKKIDLPEDDFNRRIVLFGRTGAEARQIAEKLSTRPWHNVSFFNGSFDAIATLESAR